MSRTVPSVKMSLNLLYLMALVLESTGMAASRRFISVLLRPMRGSCTQAHIDTLSVTAFATYTEHIHILTINDNNDHIISGLTVGTHRKDRLESRLAEKARVLAVLVVEVLGRHLSTTHNQSELGYQLADLFHNPDTCIRNMASEVSFIGTCETRRRSDECSFSKASTSMRWLFVSTCLRACNSTNIDKTYVSDLNSPNSSLGIPSYPTMSVEKEKVSVGGKAKWACVPPAWL